MAGLKSQLGSVWDEGKDIFGKYQDTIKAANPVKVLPAIWNGTPYDRTPGYSLGINDKLTGYNPSASIGASIGAGIGKSVAENGLGAAKELQARPEFEYIPWNPSVAGASTSRGGGGGGMSALDTLKQQQIEYADKQKGLVGQRRDAFIGDTEKGYQDQLTWLQSQADSARAGAKAGTENVNTQRDQSIASTKRTAEGEARDTRDVYQDLILENRRRTRATGAGSSSAFLELSNRLDVQLQKGLTQIGDTEVEKVGAANIVAQQAVGELERTLQNVLAQIEQNKSTSMREKDKAITDARMNADEAVLEIEKWLADSSFSISQAKATAAASYNKANYEQQMSGLQNSLLNNIGLNLANMEGAGMTTRNDKLSYLKSQIPNLQGTGMNFLDVGRYFGLIAPDDENDVPTSEITLWQYQNPGAPIEDFYRLKNQYSGFNFGNTGTSGGNMNLP